MTPDTDVTIIGAGPYGLSIAAHLKHAGVDFRIVGLPMQSWLENMPKGMLLKSAGLSSTLYDPARSFALPTFCKENGLAYADMGRPVELRTFQTYGLAFQKRMVPNLIETRVTFLDSVDGLFRISLADGSDFFSARVVVAVGLENFRNIPVELADLPAPLCLHSACVPDPEAFGGKEVIVAGAGSSAIDLAVLLQQVGAIPKLVARRAILDFNDNEPEDRPLFERLVKPMSGVGIGWGNRITAEVMPWIYPYLPTGFRRWHLRRTLGPAAGWFMKKPAGRLETHLGYQIVKAREDEGRVRLDLRDTSGKAITLRADHVIAATGYVPDVDRIPFIARDLAERVRRIGKAPLLSSRFESSVPNLYFAGPCAALSFGPIMRFSLGAGFTARRLSSHLAASAVGNARSANRRGYPVEHVT